MTFTPPCVHAGASKELRSNELEMVMLEEDSMVD